MYCVTMRISERCRKHTPSLDIEIPESHFPGTTTKEVTVIFQRGQLDRPERSYKEVETAFLTFKEMRARNLRNTHI